MDSYARDPASILDFGKDWTPWLAAGETISAATADVPAGLVKDSESFDDTTVTVWISGGTAGEVHTVTFHVTTNQGRTDERSIRLHTQER